MISCSRRVLLVAVNTLGRGGVQSSIMSIVRYLHASFTFDIVLFTNKKTYYEEEFLSYGGRIFRCPAYDGDNRVLKKMDYYTRHLRTQKYAVRLLRENRYDVIHCHNNFEAAPFVEAAKEAGIPIRIVHTHVITGKCNPVYNAIRRSELKKLRRCATAFVGCSEKACDSFYGKNGGAIVINNSFDEKRFAQERFRQKGSRLIRLLQIGNYSDLKNQLFTVHIVAILKKRYAALKCDFVGFDVAGYEDRIRNEVERLNLQDIITFYPHDADTPQLLSEATAVLLPSRTEGFGIVLIEAQAMGVQCYASDCVPESTNCGGCTYLPLSAGEEVWAERIAQDYEQNQGKHYNYDMSAYSEEKVMSCYRQLYGETK